MEIEKLLTPISQDAPCGPNLEYDDDFTSLAQASQGKLEHRIGDTVVLGEEPDWADIKERAIALFSRTKDLRVAMLLTRATTRCDGLIGFVSGLNLIQNLLERYWDDLHPCLDPDDDNDPTMRLNVLASLDDNETLVRDVRSAEFVCANSHARLSMQDVLIALGKLSATGSESVPSQVELENILRTAENEVLVKAMHDTMATWANITVFLRDKVGYERVPDFHLMSDMFKSVLPLCNKSTLEPEETHVNLNEKGAPTPKDGEIRSREDVVRMLEKICNFIERTEPTNPAPLLIRRAQSLMTMNFVEIVEELGSDGLNQIKRISGIDAGKK